MIPAYIRGPAAGPIAPNWPDDTGTLGELRYDVNQAGRRLVCAMVI